MSTDSSQPTESERSPQRRSFFAWLSPLASVKLTLTLLSLSMILVFVATLEQVRIGIRGAQAEFFESFFGVWHYPEQFWGGSFLNVFPIPIPGGYLLGGLLILNLIAAYLTRFKWTYRKMGIQIIHLGIILLLAGQLFTQAMQVESRMQINKGESVNYIERFHGVELVFEDVTDENQSKVVTIPQSLLEEGGIFRTSELPFKIRVQKFGPNCNFDFASADKPVGEVVAAVDRGVAANGKLSVMPMDEDFSNEAQNYAYSTFELLDGAESLGTWFALAHPAGNHWWPLLDERLADFAFQPFRHDNRLWGISLRHEREYLPFSIKLNGIENEFYQGTEIPFNFESDVDLELENGNTRKALVYMNTPLRHAGKTFYQYQMNKAADYTVFQVIRNPSWLVPYIACILVSLGLLWQFSFHLLNFLRKNNPKPKVS